MHRGIFKFITAMILTVSTSVFSAYSQNTEFKVTNVTPQGELPASVKYPAIQVQFSEPVVALSALSKKQNTSDIISIEPALKGVFRWYGTSILSFESDQEAIPQKIYTIKINPNLKSLAGSTIQGNLEYTFHTEDLKISSVHPGYENEKKGQYIQRNNVPLELAKDIAVFFNAPVNASVVKDYITVKATSKNNKMEQSKSLSFYATQEDKNIVRLAIKDDIPEDSDVTILLRKGAIADKDCYPSQKETLGTFHTLLTFKITDVNSQPSWYSEEYEHPVIIYFSSILKEGAENILAQYIETDLNVMITKDNISISGGSLTIYGLPVTYGQKYQLTIKGGLTDIYGRKLGKDSTYTVEVPPAKSFVRFKNRGLQTMESQFKPIISFSHQNIRTPSYYTIEPLTDATGNKSNIKSRSVILDPERIQQDKVITETIDLSPYLEKTDGEYRGAVRFKANISYEYRYREWRSNEYKISNSTVENEQIIQFSDLAMTTRYGYNKAVILVSSMKTGKPIANATVNALLASQFIGQADLLITKHPVIASAKTDSNGIAEINFTQEQIESIDYDHSLCFEAKTNNDRLIFSPDASSIRPLYRSAPIMPSSNLSAATKKQMVAFMFTDRQLYKPGETLSYTIIDRNLKEGAYSNVDANESNYTVELSDSISWKPVIYGTNKGTLNGNGICWGKFTLPNDIKPGSYTITYSRDCDGQKRFESISIDVQFFEKVRFEVHSNIEDSIYVYGDTLSALVSANYLGGGSLADSRYSSQWNISDYYFTPKKNEYKDFRFGPVSHEYSSGRVGNSTGVIDSEGKASLSQATDIRKNTGSPVRYTIETQVTDSGNQSISSSASAIVHPAQFYIGISRAKNIKGFAKKGTDLKFDYVCITPNEENPTQNILPKSKDIKMELIHENWKKIQTLQPDGLINTRYEKELVTEESRTIKIATGKPSEISIKPKESGTYILKMSSQDSKGNPVITESCFFVTGSGWFYYDNNDSQQIKLTPDRDEYSIGDTAHILMQSEVPAGTYLVTVEREGILSEKTVTVKEPTSVIDINIEKNYVPVVYVSVSTYSVRTDVSSAKKINEELPKSYYGVTALNVNTDSKKIDIQIKADKENYQPGDKAKITITATKDGKPVKNASIALMAVDRGILDLINYHVQNPLSYFYDRSRFFNRTAGGDSRSLLIRQEQIEEAKEEKDMLIMRESLNGAMVYKSMAAAAPMMDIYETDNASEASGNMAVRSNFEPTAVFEPSLITDKNGKAVCTFTLPDSLTAYRVTAVAVSDDSFGIAEDDISVCEPLSVRTVLPRLLRLDDKGELGVVISNLTNKTQNVNITLNVYDGIEYCGTQQSKNEVQKLPGHAIISDKKSEKKIEIEANKTQSLMFSLKAVKQGWITVEFIAKGNNLNEKILLPLQIEKPYIFETVTTTGSTSETAKETILIPSDADDNRYSIYVQLDPTRLGVLREAVGYVFHYPYGCMEQRSAAVLPLVAFGDYIHVFGLNSEVMYPKGVAEQEIHSWAPVQKSDGGFPYWKNGKESSTYVSMRIAEIAALAKQNGIPTGNINLSKLASYLKQEAQSAIKNSDSAWSLYNAAYACYSASLIGADINDSTIEEIAQNDNADVETLELCALTYLAKNKTEQAEILARKILSFTRMTSRGIDISQKYKNHRWCFFNDDSERYALLLQLFTKLNTKDSINQHIVYELLKMQKAHNGRWQSTAVTSRVLIALNEYIKSNNLENLNFTAEVLLNGKKELEGVFKGLTAQPVEKTIIPNDKKLEVEFTKNGQGDLYYTASMKYAIPAEKQTSRDEGLCIYTEITDVKTGKIVTENELIAGNVYQEKVMVSSRIRAEYVAVRAPVPAGCEILNTAFVTTGTLAQAPDNSSVQKWTYNRGLSYKGIYDAEVQFFWDYFPAGIQQVEFQFRAVRNGEYHTPCATAECMYEEEIFGRTDGKIWTIK